MHGNLIVSRRLPGFEGRSDQSRAHLHLRCLNILRRIRKCCFLPKFSPLSPECRNARPRHNKDETAKDRRNQKTHRIADRHDTHILRIIGYFEETYDAICSRSILKPLRPQNDGLLSCAEIFDQYIDQFFLVSNRSGILFHHL